VLAEVSDWVLFPSLWEFWWKGYSKPDMFVHVLGNRTGRRIQEILSDTTCFLWAQCADSTVINTWSWVHCRIKQKEKMENGENPLILTICS